MIRLYATAAVLAAVVVACFAHATHATHELSVKYQDGYTAGENATKLAVFQAQQSAQAKIEAARTAADQAVSQASDRSAELQKELDDANAAAADAARTGTPSRPVDGAHERTRTIVVHDPVCLGAGVVRSLRGIGAHRSGG